MIISPTMKLRWVEYDYYTRNYDALAVDSDKRKGAFVLQQYWQDNEGGGEWRDIEIEWNPEITKSE